MTMQIKELTEADLQRMYEEEVRRELNLYALRQVKEFGDKALRNTVLSTVKIVTGDLMPYTRQRADEWMKENLERMIESNANSMIQAAIGEIKRRMLSRT